MDATDKDDGEQGQLWNGVGGQAWVDAQDLMEQMFGPFEDLLAAGVSGRPARRVLDVGCGTGATTLAAARMLGADRHCVGIGISKLMIGAAQARAERDGIRKALSSALGTGFISNVADCYEAILKAYEPGDGINARGNLFRCIGVGFTLDLIRSTPLSLKR